MELQRLPQAFSVCKLASLQQGIYEQGLFFLGKTDEEISLVCETQYKPSNCTAEEDGWRGFRIKGELDFSLIGILSKISTILAEAKVGIFAVSTYNTDYILVKEEQFQAACEQLEKQGMKLTKL